MDSVQIAMLNAAEAAYAQAAKDKRLATHDFLAAGKAFKDAIKNIADDRGYQKARREYAEAKATLDQSNAMLRRAAARLKPTTVGANPQEDMPCKP